MAEGLDRFTHKIAALRGTESPLIALVTQMLETLPLQRLGTPEVLQHSWLAPLPFLGMGTPVCTSLSSGGHFVGPHPKQPAFEVAPLEKAPLPSSGGPTQPTSETGTMKEAPSPSSGGPPPEPQCHPKLSNLMKCATLLPHLAPGDFDSIHCSSQITRPP